MRMYMKMHGMQDGAYWWVVQESTSLACMRHMMTITAATTPAPPVFADM